MIEGGVRVDEMKTIVEDMRTIEVELGISGSQIKKIAPTNQYSARLRTKRGAKLWSRMIALDVSLQRTLATSPMYSGPAARLLAQARVDKVMQVFTDFDFESQMAEYTSKHGLNPVIYENLIARTRLLILTGLALPSYMLSPTELATYRNSIPTLAYAHQLHAFTHEVKQDLVVLQDMYHTLPTPLDVQQGFQDLWVRMSSNLETVLNWQIGTDSGRPLATLESIKAQITAMHHTNVPYLWADVLKAKGHIDIKVVDGPRDGSIDVDSVNPTEGDQRYLSQVKAWRNPPIGAEIVRQHAQTCRTYRARGYFVTTHRYAKNAELGQYPLVNNGTDERIKIADVELVDLDALTCYVMQYKIGVTGADRIDASYWADMQIPHSRKNREQGR